MHKVTLLVNIFIYTTSLVNGSHEGFTWSDPYLVSEHPKLVTVEIVLVNDIIGTKTKAFSANYLYTIFSLNSLKSFYPKSIHKNIG